MSDNLITKRFEENGLVVTARATQQGNGEWQLLLVDEEGNATAWEDLFPSAEEAVAEAEAAIAQEGLAFFVGTVNLGDLNG